MLSSGVLRAEHIQVLRASARISEISGARKVDGEGGSFTRRALDGDPAAVVLGHVPHYGEAQSRPSGRLGARLVHAVETLEDAWDRPLRDADAGVGDAYDYLRVLRTPDHLDPATRRCVLYGVIN